MLVTPARLKYLVAAVLLAVMSASVPAAEAPTCRDLEFRFKSAPEAASVELNVALFRAADAGCVDLARRLLAAGATLESRDRLGNMALARAARAGHLALTQALVEQGAAIDARNLEGSTALLLAAENERQATVGFLLAKGADPNLPGRSGVTALAAAAFKGNDRIVEQLIRRGADPDVADKTGKSAVTYAAARGFTEVVRRLLDAGVDPKHAYGNDLTALMWTAGHEDGVNSRAALETIELLLDRGAAIDAADNRGQTALMIAAELGHVPVVEVLLRRGADRSKTDKGRKRAIDLATSTAVREMLAPQ
jgi:uncharacterized protein